MIQSKNILDKFIAKLEEDSKKQDIPEWIKAWYWKELNPELGNSQGYEGAIELFNWYAGQSSSRIYPNTIESHDFKSWVQKSIDLDRAIFSNPILSEIKDAQPQRKLDFANYGTYNAQDYFFPQFIANLAQHKIANVIDCLKTEPLSKRAIIPIPFATEPSSTVDWKNQGQTKCCRELHFYLEDGKLKCTGLVRMQNANIFVKNIHFFATLIDHVARALDVPVGEYTHFITNVCLDRSATSC